MSELPEYPGPDLDDLPFRKVDRLKVLSQEEEEIERAYRKQAENDFMTFVRGLRIASPFGPRIFDRCMAHFQRDCFEEMAPSLHQLANGERVKAQRWWVERTKKGGKDSDIATILLWFLAFPVRPFYIQVGAANREQASIVKQRMIHLLHHNEWLNDYVELIQWNAKSKRVGHSGEALCKLDILSSDIAGAHGGTPDLLVVNELSHVQKWEFVENLMDNADGVPNGMVIIATNAGFVGTKAEVWRNNAIVSDHWKVHCLSEPAPWHSTDAINDAKSRNTYSRFLRLWKGKWVSGKGDALSEDDIARCFVLAGPQDGPIDGEEYVGCLDVGVSHDHAALMVLGINREERKIKTAWWKRWKPNPKTGEVDLMEVERSCRMVGSLFRLVALYYDPTEARLMAQRLRNTVNMRERRFSAPKELSLMADTLMQVVSERNLECYDDDEKSLRRDFGKFHIAEQKTGRGYKLEAVSDETGHADVGFALVIGLPAAVQLLDGSYGLTPEDDVTDLNFDELEEVEIDELPEDLRDIYEMESKDPFEEFDLV